MKKIIILACSCFLLADNEGEYYNLILTYNLPFL